MEMERTLELNEKAIEVQRNEDRVSQVQLNITEMMRMGISLAEANEIAWSEMSVSEETDLIFAEPLSIKYIEDFGLDWVKEVTEVAYECQANFGVEQENFDMVMNELLLYYPPELIIANSQLIEYCLRNLILYIEACESQRILEDEEEGEQQIDFNTLWAKYFDNFFCSDALVNLTSEEYTPSL